MEAKKEKISWTEKIANKSLQIQADADVIVPDTKPDISRILQVDAQAKMTSFELQSDRVLVGGVVNYNIIYMPDDDTKRPHCMKTQTPFTDVVSFKGVSSHMKGDFEAEISSVNYRIINGRKFTVKSSVEISAQISEDREVERISIIEDRGVQTKNDEIEYLTMSSEHEKIFVVNERLIIPQSEASVSEVLKVAPKICEYNVKVISNKVILKGEVQLACTYTDTTEKDINSVNHIVPFTEILDVDGIKNDDLCSVKVLASDCSYNCEEDSDGEIRSIEIQTEIMAKVVALREEKINIISDCYATTKKLNLEKKVANLPKKIADIDFQDTFKTQIVLNDNDPKINRVYDAFSKVYVDKVEQSADKFNVSGSIDNYVLYVTEEKDIPIYCVKNEIEFSESFDCEGNASVDGDFSARTLNVSYVLNDNKNVELRVNVRINGVIYSRVETPIITEVTLEELTVRPNIASITVYFVQENDTLWEIAKRYLTTVDAIKNINEGIGENVQKGVQLLIPKYKATNL